MRRRAQCYASGGRREAPRPAPAAFLASRVGTVPCHVRPRWSRGYGERVGEGRGRRKGVQFKQDGETAIPGRARGCACAQCFPPPPWRLSAPRDCRPLLGRVGRARRRPPRPRVPSAPSRPVPSGVAGRCFGEAAAAGAESDFSAPVPAAPPHPVAGPAAVPAPGCRM